jgi:hypothetical protein
VIRRGVMLWTNPGDIVLSPFMGIGSEGLSGIGKREFSLTGIKGQEGEFWADRVTGQLYSPKDGHCLSSPNLRLELGTLKASRVREAA